MTQKLREAPGPSSLKPGFPVEDKQFLTLLASLKQKHRGLRHSPFPCQSYRRGKCLADTEGSGSARWNTSSLGLYASPTTSNSKILLGYRWAQSVMQAWSVPRPAAKIRYPWKGDTFKIARKLLKIPVDPIPFYFLASNAVCDVSSDYSDLNSTLDLTLNLNCKALSSLPPPQPVAPVNQGVKRLCIPSSLVWCSAVTSWTESSVEALSPWGLSL